MQGWEIGSATRADQMIDRVAAIVRAGID